VITGLSGSGKSSLAFHTLFAEGQRRFVESLSTYARRFLGKMEHGMVDAIQGLAPAIAIDQKASNRSPRSTVATVTELYDYFRILYARLGLPHCPQTGAAAVRHSVPQIYTLLEKAHEGQMVQIFAPLFLKDIPKTHFINSPSQLPSMLSMILEWGYKRFWLDNTLVLADNLPKRISAKRIFLVIDRVKITAGNRQRVMESLEKAYEIGREILGVLPIDTAENTNEGTPHLYSRFYAALESGFVLDGELDPRNFSFNTHWGACDSCQGLGYTPKGAVCPACNGTRLKPQFSSVLLNGIHISKLSHYTVAQALDFFNALHFSKSHSVISTPLLREIIARLEFLMRVGLEYLNLDRTADTLSGGEAQRIRLASQIGSGLEGVLYVLDEPTIGLHQRDTARLIETLYRLRDLGNTVVVVEHDLEVMNAADHLIDMGPAAGEFGGEVVAQGTPAQIQRKWKTSLTGAYLAGKKQISNTQAHSSATPQQDTAKSPEPIWITAQVLSELKHNPSKKTVAQIAAHAHSTKSGASHTLTNAASTAQHSSLHSPYKSFIELQNISLHTVQNASVAIPIGALTAVTGVSGSGKSTLIMDGLLPLVVKQIKKTNEEKLLYSPHAVQGSVRIPPGAFGAVYLVDQSSLSGTPRSTPATVTKILEPIRNFFGKLPQAKVKGFTKNRFTYNSWEGRCGACEGRGYTLVEMHFLSDVWEVCEVCKGKRYNAETLTVEYKGKSIADVLDMRVSEALGFFEAHAPIRRRLEVLDNVGLGYIKLGQGCNTLSGGEAQRLRLASELSSISSIPSLYILDEPSTGLHLEDIQKLWNQLRLLVNRGNTVIFIEHQTDMIRNADWIVDMGPEGGEKGGNVLFSGTVADFLENPAIQTPTKQAL
jgi:excinuclease ABC subunit A